MIKIRNILSSRHRATRWSTYRQVSTTLRPEPFKILFLGRDEFSCVVLQQLYHSGADVWDEISLVTQPDTKVGRRGTKLSVSPLRVCGQELGLTVHTIPHEKREFKTWQLPPPFHSSSTLPQSHLLITASFGRILPLAMLRMFAPSRCLNVHPSLLPEYRGPAPIQHALLDGRDITGVSIIEMAEKKKGIDSGDIWGIESTPIPPLSNFPQMRQKLALAGGKLLIKVLRGILDGNATSKPQSSEFEMPLAPFITAEDSLVDFNQMTADLIARVDRAISHQKPLFCYLKTGKTLQLHDPTPYPSPSSHILDILSAPGLARYDPQTRSLLIRCENDTILRCPWVKQQDRALLDAKSWWNGVNPELRVGDASSPVILSKNLDH